MTRWVFVVLIVNGCSCGSDGRPIPAEDAAAADGEVMDGGEDAAPDAGTDGGIDSGAVDAAAADARADADADDAGSDFDCAEQADFTPCTIVTDPDRSYDICVEGVCVSPGCGTADCNAPGPHFPLADTGQRVCYATSGAIECASCGALCGQDAQHGWDVTNARDARFERRADAEPLVRDRVTGLVWQGCPSGLDGADCATGAVAELDWSDALAHCDALEWGGHTDWYLPDEYALHSIVDYGVDGAAIDLDAFPGTPDRWMVSSSTWAGDPDGAWYVRWYGTGLWGVVIPKTTPGQVRCVRDAAAPTLELARFVRNVSAVDRPVVSDTVTDLAWQGCEAGFSGDDCASGTLRPMTWSESLTYCDELEWGGHTDWRLPDVKQLRSISDNRVMSPGVDTDAFPNTADLPAWTSTTYRPEPARAWSVTIGFGGGIQDATKEASLAVRCVRGG